MGTTTVEVENINIQISNWNCTTKKNIRAIPSGRALVKAKTLSPEPPKRRLRPSGDDPYRKTESRSTTKRSTGKSQTGIPVRKSRSDATASRATAARHASRDP
jgi:hypothetical protein